MSAVSLMFETLSTERLKLSAVVISLFHGPKKLASENHFDVPMYKNQIGTAYEGLKDYEKAEKCYRDALSLLEKLELAGYWDEALFQRIIWLMHLCFKRNMKMQFFHQKGLIA